MDPVSLMLAVTTAYKGIKAAVGAGREAQDIVKQLGKWADVAGKMYDFINKVDGEPGLFQKISFDKSATGEAMDIMAAKQQLSAMEKEIYHMFYYGELQELGGKGYREFIQMRKKIREDRERMIAEQKKRREQAAEQAFWYFVLFVILAFAGYWALLAYRLIAS